MDTKNNLTRESEGLKLGLELLQVIVSERSRSHGSTYYACQCVTSMPVSRVSLKTRATRVISSSSPMTTTIKTNQRERLSFRNVKDLRLAGRNQDALRCNLVPPSPVALAGGSHRQRTYNLYPFRTLSVADDIRKWDTEGLENGVKDMFSFECCNVCHWSKASNPDCICRKRRIRYLCELLPVHKESYGASGKTERRRSSRVGEASYVRRQQICSEAHYARRAPDSTWGL